MESGTATNVAQNELLTATEIDTAVADRIHGSLDQSAEASGYSRAGAKWLASLRTTDRPPHYWLAFEPANEKFEIIVAAQPNTIVGIVRAFGTKTGRHYKGSFWFHRVPIRIIKLFLLSATAKVTVMTGSTDNGLYGWHPPLS